MPVGEIREAWAVEECIDGEWFTSELHMNSASADRSVALWPGEHERRVVRYAPKVEDTSEVTHIRRPEDQHAFCGVGIPNESLSLRHWLIAASKDVDIIRAGVQRVPVDRADAIRDGVQTLPHPVCKACAEIAR